MYFTLLLLDDEHEEFPEVKVFRSLSRNNAHVGIDPRQDENENLMSSLSSQNLEDVEKKDDEASFIKMGMHNSLITE